MNQVTLLDMAYIQFSDALEFTPGIRSIHSTPRIETSNLNSPEITQLETDRGEAELVAVYEDRHVRVTVYGPGSDFILGLLADYRE